MHKNLQELLKSCEQLAASKNYSQILDKLRFYSKYDILYNAELPNLESHLQMKPMYSIHIAESQNYNATCFGFLKKYGNIPLHDHSDMHGFLKILQGTIQLTTYSYLQPNEEKDVRATSSSEFSKNDEYVPVKCEGSKIITCEDHMNTVTYLSPFQGNIHSIEALEDNTAFFDLLYPGYCGRKAQYFENTPDNNKEHGQLTWLKKCEAPEYLDMSAFKL
uniref:Cysteine dioxygenase n=1 Tax=Rhabditophanes sp. KR3021 TaxID=114890 RepID=A0AC35UIM4_9BILA